MTKGKSVGRPRRDAEPGERAQLSFRVTAELKRRLDAAADQSGRSQSQEAEFRLERSFDRQDLLSEVQRVLGPIAERMSREYDRANPILATAVRPGGSMAPRSNWNGYLKLSLVTASIAIYPATSYAEEGDKGQYVQGEDEELAEMAIESTHMVDIERFVPKSSIDERYRDTPYYLAPEDQFDMEAFAVIRDAMKKKEMVGIGRVVMARRERVMMLEPFGKGIMGTLLHARGEIRSEEAVFQEIPDVKLPHQMIRLAEEIVDRMTGDFEPEKFEHSFENVLPAPKKSTERPSNVVNLMDALRRSTEDAA